MGKGGEANNAKQERVTLKEQFPGKAGVEEFWWDDDVQIHAKRPREVVKSHKLKELKGFCPWTKYKVSAAFLAQLFSLELLKDASFLEWFICCYMLSGLINGSMTLAMHELSHNLGSKSRRFNMILGLLANAPMGLPAFATFKRYHYEHHKYMGEDGLDVDVPTKFEGNTFQHSFAKLVWLFFQPAWYSLRPMVIHPKSMGSFEMMNWVSIIIVDLLVFSQYGVKGLLYLVLGTIFGMQFHPMAGHFVAEHFVMSADQETYSYYGPLNWLTFNVGYHNEHHDFAFISGTNLPKLRDMAPEFYDSIPHYHSWTKVMVDFVCDPSLSPFSRVKRIQTSEEEQNKLKEKGGLGMKW